MRRTLTHAQAEEKSMEAERNAYVKENHERMAKR